ncbi:MAG: exo-alpha-sialidase [Proteobacteria bacterium]|nr:exo-alpha-sialidase [Pseudomonadota bacterium]
MTTQPAARAHSESNELLLDGRLRSSSRNPDWLEAHLPSPCIQNHAANLMPLPNGDLGCVWFGGTQEGMADISVHFSRLPAGGDVWTPAIKIADDSARSEQNPILFIAPGNVLWLLYTSQRSGNQETAVVRFRQSRDNGMSWSEPATLFETQGTFVRQPMCVTADGRWLMPIFECRTAAGQRWTGNLDTSAVMRSSDGGRTWTRHAVPRSQGLVHMNILDLGSNGLIGLYRSRWADHVYLSRSFDQGDTWSPPEATTLPNNNSSIQAAVLNDGRIALVYNASSAANASQRRLSLYDEIEDDDGKELTPDAATHDAVSREAFWGAPRAPLCLTVSGDSGRSWLQPLTLDESDGYCITNNSRERLNREISYPSIKQTADGRIHVAYTYFRQAIKHLVLPPQSI